MFDPDELDEPEVRSKGGLLHIIKGAFRVFAEILLYIVPIICVIAGAAIGGSAEGVVGAVVGIIVGAIAGILIDIIYGGLIATLLVIEERSAVMEGNIAEILSLLKRDTTVASSKAADSADVADFAIAPEYGRTDYRTWYDPDGGKHESWIDANGNKHET